MNTHMDFYGKYDVIPIFMFNWKFVSFSKSLNVSMASDGDHLAAPGIQHLKSTSKRQTWVSAIYACRSKGGHR